MGDKVEAVLKLIEEDGDSFARRAEMYYKKRPELINFVEESYRAYRSLAERYDHISKELQNANTTLASAFPDQYQFPMDDDDDYSPRMPRKFQDRASNPNIPQAPAKFPTKNIKAIIALTANAQRSSPPGRNAPKSGAHANRFPKSGLTITEATNEIDKLQKQILTLQTEKEFAKSSYESGYAKYWDIDEQISGTQEKISKLQDEFGIAQVIEDDEARTLMAEAAIKSCNDTLVELQEKQERAEADAKADHQRIKDARDKLNSLKGEYLGNQTDVSQTGDRTLKAEDSTSCNDEPVGVLKESKGIEILREKIKEHFDVGESTSLSVLEMAEKIDELVNKVINLESSMSSQTALVHRLRSETDELQSQIKSLEDDKANLIEGKTTLTDKLGEMENKLRGLQDLNDSLENQDSNLKSHLTEARSDPDIKNSTRSQESKGSTENVDVEKEVAQDMQVSDTSTSSLTQDGAKAEKTAPLDSKNESSIPCKTDDYQPQESKTTNNESDQPQETSKKKEDEAFHLQATLKEQPATQPSTPQEVITMPKDEPNAPLSVRPPGEQPQETLKKKENEAFHLQATPKEQPATQPTDQPSTPQEVKPRELVTMPKDDTNAPLSVQPPGQRRNGEDEPDWQQLFTDGLEGKEKVLLAEYTATLRSYKETKKKLCEVEKKNEENFSDIENKLKELKGSLVAKDEEIHFLRQKLSVLQKRLDENKNAKEKEVEPAVRNEESSPYPEDDDELQVILPGEDKEISPVEQKLRGEMDHILEENLDFWMRFSASFGQIQKFQNGVQDLQTELAKLEKNQEKKEGSSHGDTHSSLKSDVRPIYKHLREIQTELTVWLEQSEKLKEELQRRFSQLCHIQEEIKHALNAGAEDDDMIFTSFQAAKFQGEVANMQQENNKVADELQAGMDYITSLHIEVERTTNRLNEDLGLSASKSQNENERSGNRARVPLRSFIFGVKPQKKKQSIFSCMHPGMMNRRYHHLRADKSP